LNWPISVFFGQGGQIYTIVKKSMSSAKSFIM
jgi:hypothetical protein